LSSPHPPFGLCAYSVPMSEEDPLLFSPSIFFFPFMETFRFHLKTVLVLPFPFPSPRRSSRCDPEDAPCETSLLHSCGLFPSVGTFRVVVMHGGGCPFFLPPIEETPPKRPVVAGEVLVTVDTYAKVSSTASVSSCPFPTHFEAGHHALRPFSDLLLMLRLRRGAIWAEVFFLR